MKGKQSRMCESQRKEFRFAKRNWLQMIKESLNISSWSGRAAGTLCLNECSSLQVSKAACILTTQTLMRLLKSREAAGAVDVKTWPTIIDTGELPGPSGSSKFCAGVTGDFPKGLSPVSLSGSWKFIWICTKAIQDVPLFTENSSVLSCAWEMIAVETTLICLSQGPVGLFSLFLYIIFI